MHTLAAAAFNVLNDLARRAGEDKKSMRDELLDLVVEDKKEWLVGKLRETENFFKHADKDPTGMHTYDPGSTTLLLIDAVRSYWNLTGEHPVLMQVFFLWFVTEHPGVFVLPSEYRNSLAAASVLMQGIPKSTLLEAMLPILMQRGYMT